jgi:hypothetical protein
MELRDQADLWSTQVEIADTSNNGLEIADTSNNWHTNPLNDDTPPKQVMWEKILADYTPSNHPSHIACMPSDGNNPPLGIQGAIAMRHRLITSTLFHFAVAHCFNADYLDHFRLSAEDVTTCPYANNPHHTHGPRLHCHT